MVYLIQESLVCVFTVMIFAILAFMVCAAVLLAEEALTRAYRALQEAAGVVSRLVPTAEAIPLKAPRGVSRLRSRQ